MDVPENTMDPDEILGEYLTAAELASMCDYEKLRLCNLADNYRVLQSLGFSPDPPEFMQPKRRKLPQQQPSSTAAQHMSRKSNHSSGNIKDKAPLRNSSFGNVDEYGHRESHKRKAKGTPSSPRSVFFIDSEDEEFADPSDDSNSDNDWTPFQPISQPKRPKKWVPPTATLLSSTLEVTTVHNKNHQGKGQTNCKVASKLQENSWQDPIILIKPLDGSQLQRLEKSNDDTASKDSDGVQPSQELSQGGEGTAPRYPRRHRAPVNYMEVEVPNDDEYFSCEDCNQDYFGECPIHGPLAVVEDTQVTCKKRTKAYAEKTLPAGLVLKDSQIPNAGLGVWAEKAFPRNSRFGPYKGILSTDSRKAHNGYSWQIYKGDGRQSFLDASDPTRSNWTRYVNCARHEEEQNLVAYQYRGQIYYRSFKDMPAGCELLVWYGDQYGRELGIQKESLHGKIIQDGVNPDMLGSRCNICQRLFSTEEYRYRHQRAMHGIPLPLDVYLKIMPIRMKRFKHNVTEGDSHKYPNGCTPCTRTAGNELIQQNDGTEAVNKMTPLSPSNILNSRTTGQDLEPVTQSTESMIQEEVGTDEKPCSGGERPHKLYSLSEPNSHDRFLQAQNGGNTTSADHLQRHNRTHVGEIRYSCGLCGQAFSKLGNLQAHERTHTGEQPYKCELCGKAFALSHHLQMHRRTHTGEKPYKCDLCDKAFVQSCDLKRHRRIHTGEKPYKCDLCDKAFSVSSNLQNHRRTHTGEKPYKCDLCSKTFSDSGNIKKHKRSHTGERPYKCDLCGKAFAQSGDLTKHRRSHTGEKPYKCDLCGKAFSQSGELKTHRRTHTGEKPFQCDLCDKAFADPSAFRTHTMRTHTGEKPFKCDLCGKAFTQSGHLQRHRRTHTGQKPYKCDLCSKSFSVSSNLVTHKRTHTREKPYKCDLCGKAFSRSGSLKAHRKTHNILL